MTARKANGKLKFKWPLPPWALAAVIAASLGCIYLIPTLPALQRFSQDTSLVPNGDFGDQSYFVWAIAKAKRSSSFSDFVTNCEWSDKYCFDIRADAVEWNVIYLVGRLARFLDIGERPMITSWYFGNLFICLVAAFVFIWVISENLWAALALSGLVGFQQTLVQRIQGHMTLVTWWASAFLLALEWACLKKLCAPGRAKSKGKDWLLPSLWALCLFVTVNLSFYHTLFVSLLAPALLVAFLYSHKISLKTLIRKPGFLKLTVIVAFAAVVSLYSVKWAFLGGVRELTFNRTDYQVSLYSARVQDYILPNVDASNAYAWLNPLHLANDPSRVGNRLEVLSYLGLAFFLGFMFTIVYAARSKDHALARRSAKAFFVLFLFAAFLGTDQGGLLVHRYATFVRCFNRMASYVVMFGCTFMALVWSRDRRINKILPAVMLLAFCFEYRNTSLLSPALLKKMASVDRLAGQMKDACKTGGSIRVDPPNYDYMMGPYGAVYAAEIARCRLTDVNGPGAMAQATGFVAPPVSARLVWPGDYYGADPSSFRLEPPGPTDRK